MKNFILLLLFLQVFTINAQVELLYSTLQYCSEENKGIINIDLIHKPSSTWSPPYLVEFENVDTGLSDEITVNDNFFEIVDLDKGSYTVTVHLDDETSLVTDCPVIDGQFQIYLRNLQNSCNNDGLIELLQTDPPIDFIWEDGFTGHYRDELTPGIYNVTATFFNGCEAYRSIEIQPTLNDLEYVQKNNCTNGQSEGLIVFRKENNSFDWSPSVNTFDFFGFHLAGGLANGDYCVTVTDDDGCTNEKCFEIITSEPIDFTNINVVGACPNGNLGEISFDTYMGPSESTWSNDWPVEITWTDSPDFDGVRHRQNLVPDTYTAIITDGCSTATRDFVVGWDCTCPKFTEPKSVIGFACSPIGTEGFIALLSHHESFNFFIFDIPFFEFEWSGDHPVTLSPDNRTATNLRKGNYSVKIKHAFSDCEITENFTVGIEKPIQISSQVIEPSCSNEGTGSIEFEYTGGSNTNGNSVPGVIKWEDLPINSTSRDNLLPGDYCVLISSNCYDEAKFCFEVPEYELEIQLETTYSSTSCTGHEVQVEVSGDNPPFDFNWSNGKSGSSLQELDYGVYTVTVTDSQGCASTETVEMFPAEIVEMSNACPEFQDGAITIQINNPNNVGTNVYLETGWPCSDCGTGLWPMTLNDTSDPIIIQLDNLVGNQDYFLDVFQTLPNGEFCSYQFPFHIGEDDFGKIFVDSNPIMLNGEELDNIYECIYDIVCKDLTIPNGVVELSTFEQNDECDSQDVWQTIKTNFLPFTNSQNCGSVDIYCDDELIETVDVKAEKMRAGQHEALMREVYGLSYADLDWELDPCRQTYICPQDPLCHLNGWGGNVFQGDFKGIEDLGNGCYKVKCKAALFFNRDYEVCGLDFLSDEWQMYITSSNLNININLNNDETIEEEGFVGPCNPIERNLYEVWLKQDRMLEPEWSDQFIGSELQEFLNSDYFFENIDAAKCTNIKFCTSDFSVIETPILEDVECEIIETPIPFHNMVFNNSCESFEGTMNGTEGMWVACDPDNPQPTFISFDEDDFYLSCDAPPREIQILTAKTENTSFGEFAFSRDRFGRKYPNAIYKGETSTSSYYHHFREEIYDYSYAWQVKYSIELPDEGYGYYIVRDSIQKNKFQLISGDPYAFVDNILVAGGDLDLNNFNDFGEDFLLKGSYTDGIALNNTTLSGNINSGEFLMEMKKDGSIGENHFIDSDNYLPELSKHSNSQFYRMAGTSQTVNVDGTNYSNYKPGTIFEAQLNENGLEVNTDIRTTGPMKMISTEYNSDKTKRYYLFKGQGNIFHKNKLKVKSTTDKVVIMEVNTNYGTYKGYKYIDLENVNSLVPNMEIDEDGFIYIAANVGDDDQIANLNYPSPSGGNDIVVLKLNSSRNVVETYEYETSSKETIQDIFYSSDVLFLGGELEGNTFEREIGDMTFYNFSSNTKLGFVSYINLRDQSSSEEYSCSVDCSAYINFIENDCSSTVIVSGPDVDNYYLQIVGPNGYADDYGFLSVDTYEFEFTEAGEYSFRFIAANSPCEDLEYNLVIEETCIPPTDLCSSINTSASGDADWIETFTSDGYGILTLIFNSVSVPDQLLVRKNGVLIVDSGYYSRNKTQAQADASYPGCGAIGGAGQNFIAEINVATGDVLEIEIVADNCGTGNTQWYLDAECSGSSNVAGLMQLSSRRRIIEDDTRDAESFILVYPNPAKEYINVEVNLNSETHYTIYNSTGLIVGEGVNDSNDFSIETTHLNSGVYTLTVKNNDTSLSTRFVIISK